MQGPNGKRQGQRTDLGTSGNISGSERGETKDIAAAKAGLGSGKTLEAAQKVVERGIPELVEAIAERLQGRVGNPALRANCGNISTIERGDTRDIAAAKAGLGSGKTLEAAQKVVERGIPELVEAIAERLQGRHGSNQYQQKGGGNISTSSDDAGKTRDIAAAKAGLGSGKTLEAAQKVVERGIPELAEAIAERLQGRNKRPEKSGNISGLTEHGDTRDIAAAKAGLGSAKRATTR